VREVFHDALIPAFKKRWKAEKGEDVAVKESYNASGAQVRAIKSGFGADLAVLSHEADMNELVKAGLVASDWNGEAKGPSRGMLSRSLVVIGHRPDKPVAGWADLAKPGVGVLYPDPKTSGGARWNVAAIYGDALLESKEASGQPDLKLVRDRLAKVQANVVNMDASGRQSMSTFERGTGDAIVSYENELLLRRKEGREIPYVIPERTLLIESPVALVQANVEKHGNAELAAAFLAFLTGPEGQAILADYGFRPVDEGVPDQTGKPLPAKVFTIRDLGGWDAVNRDVFGPEGAWTSVFAPAGRGG
jgi:sulfate transport system substrate-binding protein